jgi:DNA-directed RNA polymerase specialized sigma24 family protein
VRAWRVFVSFEARSSERTWLYRIATNACLTALQHRSRRVLPSGLGAPSADPSAPPDSGDPAVAWLQPIPDTMVSAAANDPAARTVEWHLGQVYTKLEVGSRRELRGPWPAAGRPTRLPSGRGNAVRVCR